MILNHFTADHVRELVEFVEAHGRDPAYRAGYNSAKDDKAKNPHKDGSPEHLRWATGHQDGLIGAAPTEPEFDVQRAVAALMQHYKVRRNDPLREKHRAAGWPFGPEACDR